MIQENHLQSLKKQTANISTFVEEIHINPEVQESMAFEQYALDSF